MPQNIKKTIPIFITAIFVIGVIYSLNQTNLQPTLSPGFLSNNPNTASDSPSEGGLESNTHPLQIEYLRLQDYPGSELTIEQTLTPGSNYQQHIVSYKSEGLKQFALLTIPNGQPPAQGWPAIVFNHGYIQPSVYRTTERYVAYVDGFARNGYIVLKPDYRGHGNSEGRATGGYGTPDYTIDVLNALASLQTHANVDPNNIGMWGHSMGGWITQRAMVINPNIKAGVIWAGVVGSYPDLFEHWRRNNTRVTAPTPLPSPGGRGFWRYSLSQQYGDYNTNQQFWDSISSTSFLSDISGPIQLHHATGDSSVNYKLSEIFDQRLKEAGQISDLHIYQGDDHNITANFSRAMTSSIEFFDQYLKSK